MQLINQIVYSSSDVHSFLINYNTQMLYMFVVRSNSYKSCVTSPYYQKMPPPDMFAGASYDVRIFILISF